jgi:hypothetical protein
MSDPKRYWFSPHPFIRWMELLSVVPLLLSLTASGWFYIMLWYFLTLPLHQRDIATGMALLIIACMSMAFFAVAGIFVLLEWLHLDYPNSPKGLISIILYRFSAILVLPFFLSWLVVELFNIPF